MSKSKPRVVVTFADDDIRRHTAGGLQSKFRYLNSLRQRVLDGLSLTSHEAHEIHMAQAVYGPEWWHIYIGYQRLQWREARARRRARLRVGAAAAVNDPATAAGEAVAW